MNMESLVNKENEWDHTVEADAVQSQVHCLCRKGGTGIKRNENWKIS